MSNRRVGSNPVSRTSPFPKRSIRSYARVVELADSLDSGSSVHYGRAGSSPASRTKKERHLLEAGVLLFWVPPSKGRLLPTVIEMLGRSEFALRRGFVCGKTLVRRKCAAGQKAGLTVLLLLSQSLKISILTAPCIVGAKLALLRLLFSCGAKRYSPSAPLLFPSKSAPPSPGVAFPSPTKERHDGCRVFLSASILYRYPSSRMP